MLGGMFLLPFLDVCAKFLGEQGMPIIQAVWARLFFGAVMMLPFVLQDVGTAAFVPQLPKLQVLRAVLLIASTALFFGGMLYLPIADTLAIFFVQPLLVTALSPWLLKEKVGWDRWLAVFIGFIGVLIIIRPGFKELNLGVPMALGSGLSMAIYLILTRKIAGQVSAVVTTFQTNAIGALILSIVMPFIWLPPELHQWGLLLVLALIAIAGHFLIVRAYDYAEASLLSPLGFSEMIMAVAAGWYFFGDFPDSWTFLGVSILITSAIFISMRWQKPALTN
jgi:drug/metabolite transporter (DMT)-like permease